MKNSTGKFWGLSSRSLRFSAIITLLISLSGNYNSYGQEIEQVVRGRILDEVTLQPIEGVYVVFQQLNLQTTTDSEGRWAFEKVPMGRYDLTVSHVSYDSKLIQVLVISGKESVHEIRLNSRMIALDEVVISNKSWMTRADRIGEISISMEQTNRIPANFFDPVRVATSLPGIVAANDQANHLVVRGNSPNTVKWRLEGMSIVNPNHQTNAGTLSDLPQQAGGGVNILSGQMLADTKITTTPIEGSLGNGLTFFDMSFRDGNRETAETTLQASVIGFDVAREGPVGKGSLLTNYRYSFVGLLTAAGIDFGGESISFQDLSFNYSIPTKKGKFKLFGFGGLSKNIFRAGEDQNEWVIDKDSQDIDYEGNTGGVGSLYETQFGNASSLIISSIISGTSQSRWNIDNRTLSAEEFIKGIDNSADQSIWSTRAELQAKHRKGIIGFGILTDLYNYRLNINGITKSDQYYVQPYYFKLQGWLIQPYINSEIFLSKDISVNTVLRYNYFSYNGTGSIDPRIFLNYNIFESGMLSLGYSKNSFIQPLEYYAFHDSNPIYKLEMTGSQLGTLGYTWSISDNFTINSVGYYQRLTDVPVSLFVNSNNLFDEFLSSNYRNLGDSRSYGLEVTGERRIQQGFYLLGGGSIYSAEYYLVNEGWTDARYDGDFTLNLTLGREKRIQKTTKDGSFNYNFRLLFLGGFNEAEIDEAESQNVRSTIRDYENGYAIPLEDYFRIDASFYWKINRPNRTSSFGLDIQNVLNRENSSGFYYDSRKADILGKNQLGLIPVMYYRIEF